MAFRFQGRVDKLEIARGHDGLFRGPPDPVLALGVYIADASTFRMLGRSLHRFRPRSKFPSDVAPDVTELPSGSIETTTAFRYIVLAIALEEDGGLDVQRIYGALEHHRLLTVWSGEHDDLEPFALGALPETPRWSTPAQVQLALDGVTTESCRSDKFIGAVCWTMPPHADAPMFPYRPSIYRLPFLSADQKNDWTALVSISH